MKSVRLSPSLEARLKLVSLAEGIRPSETMRRAIARHCDEVLGATLDARLSDIVGVVRTTGGRAGRTGVVFKRILRRRR